VTPTPALVSVRFLLALWVVLYHVLKPLLAASTSPLAHLAMAGPCAVTFFFVLSGFVLTLAYASPHASTDASPDDSPVRGGFAPYARARFARLAPLYGLSLLLVIPLGLAARKHGLVDDPHSLRSLLLVALALQAWSPADALRWNPALWSLSVEVFAYALLPLALRATRTWTRNTAIAGAAVLAVLAVVPALARLDLAVVRFFPLLRVIDFLAGVCLARAFVAGARLPSWVAAVAALLLGVALASDGLPLAIVDGSAPVAFALVVVLALASVSRGPLASARFVQLGDASYALYALHLPVLFWTLALTHTPPDSMTAPLAVIVVACAIASAIGAHVLIERPLRERLRRASS
jgi:peptidoglycan/LPS O-acetylase OafA/YrhL